MPRSRHTLQALPFRKSGMVVSSMSSLRGCASELPFSGGKHCKKVSWCAFEAEAQQFARDCIAWDGLPLSRVASAEYLSKGPNLSSPRQFECGLSRLSLEAQASLDSGEGAMGGPEGRGRKFGSRGVRGARG